MKHFGGTQVYNTFFLLQYFQGTRARALASIWIAQRGSTMSFILSRRRTQSGANLREIKRLVGSVSSLQHKLGQKALQIADNCIPAHWFWLPWGGLEEETSIERRVHFLFDFVSLSIHFALSKCELADATNAIRNFGKLSDLLFEKSIQTMKCKDIYQAFMTIFKRNGQVKQHFFQNIFFLTEERAKLKFYGTHFQFFFFTSGVKGRYDMFGCHSSLSCLFF